MQISPNPIITEINIIIVNFKLYLNSLITNKVQPTIIKITIIEQIKATISKYLIFITYLSLLMKSCYNFTIWTNLYI